MNVWILTIGSSDVQLTNKTNWTKLFRDVRSQLDDRGFSPSEGLEGKFQVPARVMGTVYHQSQAARHFDDLIFPLIDNFINKIQNQSVRIDQIFLILSDQSVFDKTERSSQNHAYWQDTCTLQPLLEKYLNQKLKENSPNLEIQALFLRPTSTAAGLDDWDAVLRLVQDEFSSLDFPDNATIYVSHQAGTPAISSAVQFASLSRFGNQVEFLVSNERDVNLTKILPSSAYLKGIRKQEAFRLLHRHDYSGVEALVEDYLQDNEELKALLNAAIQWNVARFSDFLEALKPCSKFVSDVDKRTRLENWWWRAYEEVYLAVVRKNQDNIVEAFFHSFRAFEGIFASWGHSRLPQYIETIDEIPYLSPEILDDSTNEFSSFTGKSKKSVKNIKSKLENLKDKIQEGKAKITKYDRVEMDLRTLCDLFKAFRYSDYSQNCQALKIFWDDDKEKNVSDKRNFIVHQVKGMSESDLWNFWGVSSWEECQSRLLQFLNFIVKEDLPQGFSTLEEASLMAKVHKELKNAIAQL